MSRRLSRVMGVAALLGVSTAGLFILLDASAAAAATTSGCRAVATSFDESGTQVDRLAIPGPGGTADDPFRVDPSGSVQWRLTSGDPGDNGTWSVTTPGAVDLGFDGENGSAPANSGIEGIQPHVTRKLPGLGRVQLASGTTRVVVVVRDVQGRVQCTLGAFVKVEGSPLRTPLFWLAVVLGLLGGALVVVATPRRSRGNARTHLLLGLLGGALVGIAVAAALTGFGVVAYGTATPLVVVGAVAGAGAAWGCLGSDRWPRRTRRPAEPELWVGPPPRSTVPQRHGPWSGDPGRPDEAPADLPADPEPRPPDPEVVAGAETDEQSPKPPPIRWQADEGAETR